MTDEVINWYENELELNEGSKIRLFVRYGDGGSIPSFSLGIRLDEPNEIHSEYISENTTYFIEKSDAWYFENKNLYISLNESTYEPEFNVY